MADWIEKFRIYPFMRSVPLSPEELDNARKRAVLRNMGAPAGGFTCDNCDGASICVLAFDGYNTNGDCLYEK